MAKAPPPFLAKAMPKGKTPAKAPAGKAPAMKKIAPKKK